MGEMGADSRTEIKGENNNKEGSGKEQDSPKLRVKELGPSPIFLIQASAVVAHIGSPF